MKLADKILFDLMNFAQGGRDIVIPNFYYDWYEMDLFRLTHSGIIYEYEVKISRADFKADFEKGYQLFSGNRSNKHSDIVYQKYKVNKFYFVVPKGLIKPEEVPSRYGLIYYDPAKGWDKWVVIRPAKMLRPKFEVDYAAIAFKLSFRESIMRIRLRRYKADYKELLHDVGKADTVKVGIE